MGLGRQHTFAVTGDFQFPDYWDWHCPDYYVFEDTPRAVEYVHGDEVDAAHGPVEDFGDVPVIGDGVTLEDIAL